MIVPYSFGTEVPPSKFNNVIDKYKMWTAAEIRADLQPNRSQMVSIFENTEHNINVACGIRANNAFLGKCVYVVGRRRYDRRGAVGTHHYETVYSADTIEEVVELLHEQDYKVFVVDNTPDLSPSDIRDTHLPYKSAFIFGNEGEGVSDAAKAIADGAIYIHQTGSVRSLNVSCAASIVMYEYTRYWG